MRMRMGIVYPLTIVASFHGNTRTYRLHSPTRIFFYFVFCRSTTILFSVSPHATRSPYAACDACTPFVPFAVAPPSLFFVPPPTALETIQ